MTEYRYSEWHWWYLQCFDAVGWAAGRASGLQRTEWLGACVVICLERSADLWSSWCHCHSLSLASVKSRLVLPFWYRLTRVVPNKGPLNGCVWVTRYVVYKSQCNCWFNDGVSAIEVGAALTAEWNHWANVLQVIQVCTHKHRVTHRQYHRNTTV